MARLSLKVAGGLVFAGPDNQDLAAEAALEDPAQHVAAAGLLLPVGDLEPPDDPVGSALGLLDDDDQDPDHAWREVMFLFGSVAARAYYQAQSESRSSHC